MHCGIRPQPRPDMVAATELQKGLPNCFEMRGFAPDRRFCQLPSAFAEGCLVAGDEWGLM